jgi:hypothetical protein
MATAQDLVIRLPDYIEGKRAIFTNPQTFSRDVHQLTGFRRQGWNGWPCSRSARDFRKFCTDSLEFNSA